MVMEWSSQSPARVFIEDIRDTRTVKLKLEQAFDEADAPFMITALRLNEED